MWQNKFPKKKTKKNPLSLANDFRKNENIATENSLFIFILRILAKFRTPKKKSLVLSSGFCSS
jgi:hypothetical protein